jgi:ATP-dependent Clp protease protease subunit
MNLNWKNPYTEEIASFLPNVITKSPNGERSFDLFSLMLNKRIVMMHSEVEENMSSIICASLLYLESEDSSADISLYINSPGGSVTAGLAIYDTLNFVQPDIMTLVMGQACSMGFFLACAGTPGKRHTLPSSRYMCHQPSSGSQGQATDILIHAKETGRLKEYLTKEMARNCNMDYDHMYEICERDHWMDAQEAIDFGAVDSIMDKRQVKEMEKFSGRIIH